MKQIRAYKVFLRRGNRLGSMGRGKNAIWYPLDTFTEATPQFAKRGYHPLGFLNRPPAEWFFHAEVSFGNYELWGVLAEEEMLLPPPLARPDLADFSSFAEKVGWWWEIGTRMFKRVKPDRLLLPLKEDQNG